MEALIFVKPQRPNLSLSAPDMVPQISVSLRRFCVGIFITKSPELFIILLECLEGLIEIAKRGGFEQATPHHAMVIMFAES